MAYVKYFVLVKPVAIRLRETTLANKGLSGTVTTELIVAIKGLTNCTLQTECLQFP